MAFTMAAQCSASSGNGGTASRRPLSALEGRRGIVAPHNENRASNQGRSANPGQGALKTYPGRRPLRGAAFKALLFN